MLIFINQVIFWVIFVYGFLSLAQDIFYEFTYKKINQDIKIFMIVKSFENKLDEFIGKFIFLKKYVISKNIALINLNKEDDFIKINKALKKNDINWDVLSPDEGKNIIINCLKNS